MNGTGIAGSKMSKRNKTNSQRNYKLNT